MGPRQRTWKRRAAQALSKSNILDTFEQLPGQRFPVAHRHPARDGHDREINMDLKLVDAQGSPLAPTYNARNRITAAHNEANSACNRSLLHFIQKCSTVRDPVLCFFEAGGSGHGSAA